MDEDAGAVTHLVIMGVSGSGKTTVATQLSERLGWSMADADDFHPQANIAKMAAGEPLTDADRWPWLRLVGEWIGDQAKAGERAVVACSALRRVYRDVLRQADERLFFVHLAGDESGIGDRMRQRNGHFMPAALLRSQLDALEPLDGDEDGVIVPMDVDVDRLIVILENNAVLT
jgi:gluconokinase